MPARPDGDRAAIELARDALGPVALTLGTLLPLAALDGGYFPTTWGWAGVVLAALVVVLLILRADVELGVPELVTLGALVALLGWVVASTAWSASVTRTVLDAERALVYVVAFAAAVLVVRERSYRAAIAGIWGAVTLVSLYSLGTRLFPDRLGVFDPAAVYRLSEPLGYWNALGILAASSYLLALGLAARANALALRLLAAASVIPLILVVYFSFSRAAWLAAAIGLGAWIALDPRRLHALVVMPLVGVPSAIVVWQAAESEALTTRGAAMRAASAEGHDLALVAVVALVATIVVCGIFAGAETRLHVPRPVRAAYAGTLIGVAALAAVLVFARFGSPPELVRKAHQSFTRPSAGIPTNLNERLFTLSGRREHWEVAWSQYKAHPWLGAGAGTYEHFWLRERDVRVNVRDAHSVYLEVLAELGPAGLALLAVALAVPLAVAVRVRGSPLVPPVAGAYVALVVHASVDWDWEMPAVIVGALLLAAALFAAGRRRARVLRVGVPARLTGVLAAVALSLFAFAGLMGNVAVADAESASAVGNWDDVAANARDARRWAPWSSQPWELLGEAKRGRGDAAGARESFREAIEREPRNWELWLELATVTEGPERRRALAEAERLNPLTPLVDEVRGRR